MNQFYTLESLAHLLELSISPIVLISGVGLLLISQTNRLARAIDRSRKLAGTIREQEAYGKDTTAVRTQLKTLFRRCQILRTAITLLASSILCAGIIILLIALMSFFDLAVRGAAVVIFFVGIACLVGSISMFLIDIFMGLRAIELEVREYI